MKVVNPMSQLMSNGTVRWRANRWGMLVGINHYTDHAIPCLPYCVNDIVSLYDLLGSRPEYGYGPQRLVSLTSLDSQHLEATKTGILNALVRMASLVGLEDLLLFYFAGHGTLIDNEAYLLPADAITGELLPDSALSLSRIKKIMQKSPARAKVMILDACHAGVELMVK